MALPNDFFERRHLVILATEKNNAYHSKNENLLCKKTFVQTSFLEKKPNKIIGMTNKKLIPPPRSISLQSITYQHQRQNVSKKSKKDQQLCAAIFESSLKISSYFSAM
jgi:hypothetical protein